MGNKIIICILLLMVSLILLSGCIEQKQSESEIVKAEYKIMNYFPGLITGKINIYGWEGMNNDGLLLHSATQTININEGQIKSYWFEVSKNSTLSIRSWSFGCTARYESGISGISDEFYGGAFGSIPFTATFRITGTPPLIKVEFSSDKGATWRDT